MTEFAAKAPKKPWFVSVAIIPESFPQIQESETYFVITAQKFSELVQSNTALQTIKAALGLPE